MGKETLTENNKWYVYYYSIISPVEFINSLLRRCSGCGKSVLAGVKTSVAVAPEVLVIQLKRFDDYGYFYAIFMPLFRLNFRRKISKRINFETEFLLDVAESARYYYSLFAVSVCVCCADLLN
jgi:ubiquitin C-terminal hydrolase